MRLLVFLHGTVLMHPSALGRSREERVAQVRAGADLRGRIRSIVVPEFGGIDHLPDGLQDLLTFEP
jgi:hypothetical protein